MEWMILPLRRYAQFSGRSQRKEFWLWVLFLIIATIVMGILDSVLGLGGRTQFGPNAVQTPTFQSYGYAAGVSGGWLSRIFFLAILIPNIAVSVRRLHDTDRSGWWVLAPLLPYVLTVVATLAHAPLLSGLVALVMLIASIVLLVWYCSDGTRGPNRFGPDPKADPGDLHETFR